MFTQPKLIYLASPYSDPDRVVRENRYQKTLEYFVTQIRRGVHLFSPILHSVNAHNESCIYGPGILYEEWISLDLNILKRCDELHILTLPGWELSKGVAVETKFAKDNNIPTKLVYFSI